MLGEPEDDLACGNASERGERVDVALQERILATGDEDPMDGLAQEREPEREQHAGHLFAAQVDRDLPEIDLRPDARPVRLRHSTSTGPSPASARIFGLRSAT